MKLLKVNNVYYDIEKYYTIRYCRWSFLLTFEYYYNERQRDYVPKEYTIEMKKYCFEQLERRLGTLLQDWLIGDEKLLDIDEWYDNNTKTLEIDYGI